jgi:predicted TIM-barrel fold metal-dependent hydrolase
MASRPLISTDSHVEVPITLADELPEHLRAKVPHLETRADGVYLVRPFPAIADADGKRDQGNMMTQALAAGIKIDADDEALLARIQYGSVAAEANPGFTIEGRLKEMERDGVVGEVLISTGSLNALSDAEVAVPWSTLTNDCLFETYKEHFDKFAVGINLPLCDIDASVKELERAAGLGLRPAVLPYCYPGRSYGDLLWEPLWEAAEGLGVPLAFHLGFRPDGTRSSTFSGDIASDIPEPDMRPRGWHLTQITYGSAATTETVGALVNSGVLERHPGLTVVMTETAAGWLGWMVEFMDYYYGARFNDSVVGLGALLGAQEKPTAEPPSHYIKRQVKCTFMYDPVAVRLRDITGLDCLMWGNDYPHLEGVFPFSAELNDKQFEGVPENEVMAMVHDNAAAVYGLTV